MSTPSKPAKSRKPKKAKAVKLWGRKNKKLATPPGDVTSDESASENLVDNANTPVAVEENPEHTAMRKKIRDDIVWRSDGGTRRAALASAVIIASFGMSLAALASANSRPTTAQVRETVQTTLKEAGTGFPTGEGAMWASAALHAWATWDENRPETREALIAEYLASGLDPQAGWNEQGTQRVIGAYINPTPEVRGASSAIYTGLVLLDDGTTRCYGLPTATYRSEKAASGSGHGFALAANPAPVSCPGRAGVGKAATGIIGQEEGTEENREAGQVLKESYFPAFFAAWGGSRKDELRQYVDGNIILLGLGGQVATSPPPIINNVTVYTEKNGVTDGRPYVAQVGVEWTTRDGSATLRAEYILQIIRRGGQWLVASEPVPVTQASNVSDAPRILSDSDGSGDGVYVTPAPAETSTEPTEGTEPTGAETTEPAVEPSETQAPPEPSTEAPPAEPSPAPEGDPSPPQDGDGGEPVEGDI